MSKVVSNVSRVPVALAKPEGFDDHAVAIAKRQYFQAGDKDLGGLFERVANWVASPESDELRAHYIERFYELMASKRFCPGGRVLAGAATSHGNVLNCFVQDGRPHNEGTTDWVLHLATKLALVTKVGGGNGLCLDAIKPRRDFDKPVGKVYMTVNKRHADYDKVKDGTYMDLVHGQYVSKGYRVVTFVESELDLAAIEKVTVGDSVESIWQSASTMISHLLDNKDVLLDLSHLRPEGTPVNGSGGNSSGPSSFAVEVFDHFALWASLGGAEYAGPVATLRYIFAPTLRVIRQGGTRRGAGMATMSISHPDIYDFITSKDLEREKQEGDISTFNISVLVDDKFMTKSAAQGQQGVLWDIAEHAWQTGEPGLIYIDRINEHNAMREAYGNIKATNPCVTADTWVMTQHGARQVHQLKDRDFCALVEGASYGLESAGFFSTGVKPVFKLRTRRGFELKLTANHQLKQIQGKKSKWTPLERLSAGDCISLSNQRSSTWAGRGSQQEGWLLGYFLAEGSFVKSAGKTEAALDFWLGERAALVELSYHLLKDISHPLERLSRSDNHNRSRLTSLALARLAESFGVTEQCLISDEIEQASMAFYQGFLRGYCEARACVQGDSLRVSGERVQLQRLQRMLARLGILSSLLEKPYGEGYLLPEQVKAGHSLVITGDNLALFAHHVGLSEKHQLATLTPQDDRLESFCDVITSIEAAGEEEVFDVTVEHIHAFDANGVLAHNCGEIPLYPGEPCDLGAINLSQYVSEHNSGINGFDWASFQSDVKTCIRFLDNVLDVNVFALSDNHDMSMKMRRLGLGIMGLADALIKMGYRYDSDQGREAVKMMIAALRDCATLASQELAVERGCFPEFDKASLLKERRNVALLTVAPTGTTSMLMGVSSGVEPIFAPFIYRKIGDSYAALIAPLFKELLERHPAPKGFQQEGDWDWDKVVARVQENHGSVQGLDFIPDDVKAVLVCAHDISPEDHVKMQGVVQSTFDDGDEMVANSISKTINMPNQASTEDVYDAYRLAFETGCKGVTVYRDGSRQFQVLSTSSKQEENKQEAHQDEIANPEAPKSKEEIVAQTPVQAQRLPGEPLFDRPARLTGFTDNVKLTLPNGDKRSFYISINTQDDLPTEVFIFSGKGGEETNADSEALGRLASIALQYGVPAEAIVKTLRGINGGMYGTYQGRMVHSKADLIAVALETTGVENVLNQGKGCPDCGAPLRFEEGCQKCESCGYSKCG